MTPDASPTSDEMYRTEILRYLHALQSGIPEDEAREGITELGHDIAQLIIRGMFVRQITSLEELTPPHFRSLLADAIDVLYGEYCR